MNTTSLVDLTAEETGQTEATVKAAFKIISGAVASGEVVELGEFGTFSSQMRSIREGRNPTTGESTYIPAPRIPTFFPGQQFLEVVNK